MSSTPLPWLSPALRPSLDEIESFARLIMRYEGRTHAELPDCRIEAELHLWVNRCLGTHPRKTFVRRRPAEALKSRLARTPQRVVAAAAR